MTDTAAYKQAKLEKWTIPEPNSGCLLWFGCLTARGYGLTTIGGRDGYKVYSHRLAYALAFGVIPNGRSVLHRCDMRCCCNPNHLFLGTSADNTDDMIAKDRHCRGERSPMAKLTDQQIPHIRKDVRSLSAIARDYGVDIKQIHRIKRRENWKHVA